MSVFFISYKRENMAFAKEVKRQLENAGLLTWLDDDRMLGGDEWKQVIDTALRECIAVIVVVTPDALKSQYVTYEWSFALGCGKRVIPIIREFPDPNNPAHPKMHPRLDDKQYRDFTTPNDGAWERLIRELQVISAKDHVPAELKEAEKRLYEPDTKTRQEAIQWLSSYDDRDMVIEIFARGAQSKAPQVKMDCALALTHLDRSDERAISGLVLAAAHPHHRSHALAVLSQMNSEAAVLALEQCFDTPGNEALRVEIARAMAKVTHPAVIPVLIKVTSIIVIIEVLQALGQFGDPRALSTLKNIVLKQGIVNAEGKRWAIAALGKIKDPSIPDLLIEIFQKYLQSPGASESDTVCTAAMTAAAELGGETALKVLQSMQVQDSRSGRYWLALQNLISQAK